MGHQAHPTVNVSDEPEKVYSVVDRRDSYHPHTVAKFESESAADELKEQLTAEKTGPSTIAEDRWFIVRETPIFQSVEEYEDYNPREYDNES